MDTALSIITMVGGLAFFLFGMTILGSGLEKLAGGKMEVALEKMTSTLPKSLFLGILVTAAIQSSSATTVIVVGLVNAGVLKLRNAVGVIMGANIGTTITSIILSLGDLDKGATGTIMTFLKPESFTPIIALVGVVLLMASHKSKLKLVGEIMLGFGVLFNGMFIMTDAVTPLADSPAFQTLFATLSNPVLGVLAGALVTAVLQSSSASIGILQAVASTGAVRFSAALPIIMGQNIGTCVTSLISSIGANKNARRAAMVHLYFNIIGTVAFMTAAYLIQSLVKLPFWNDQINMGGISAVHITFNVSVTLIFIPFTRLLERLAIWTVRDRKGDNGEEDPPEIAILEDRLTRTPTLALSQCHDALQTMGAYAKRNFQRAVPLFTAFDQRTKETISEYESAIDRMEDKLNKYLIALTNNELTMQESQQITFHLKMVLEFERIGDYAMNVMELAESLHEKQVRISSGALEELAAITDAVDEIIGMALKSFAEGNLHEAHRIEPLEEIIDTMEDSLKFRHIERLKSGECTVDGGITFLELLTNLERISDHCSNVGFYVVSYHSNQEGLDRHEYLKRIHDGSAADYQKMFADYKAKYYSRIEIASQ